MANDIGGVWRTVGGRRIFIKDGQDLTSAMKESGKFNKTTQKERYEGLITSEENSKRTLENQKKYDEYTKERDDKIKELNKMSTDKEITNEEYDKKWLDIMHEYEDKTAELKQKKVFDSKKDDVLYLKKDNVFTDENKKYKDVPNAELTDEEKEAITRYTGSYDYGSYNNINKYLNGQEVYLSQETKQKMLNNIEHLDNAMNKSKIGNEYQLYRGIEPSKIGDPEIANAITKINKGIEKGKMMSLEKQIQILSNVKGKEIETKGYMSTSKYLDPNYTKRGVTLVINTQKDDRAIDISALSKYNGKRDTSMLPFYSGTVQTEDEVLYDRNTKLKVKDFAITDSGIFLLCDTEQEKKKK